MRPGREPAAFLGRGNSPVRQHFPQILPRIRFRAGGDLLGRTGADDLSAAVTALGAQVDDMVGGFNHIQVVLDDQHGISALHQPLEHLNELLHIGGVLGSSKI